ncbi:MAG: AAA family ATPase [Deltaproteobacteria bacterium]|nr:AAA family ATPase [Deltaproteobacteria bacterium]
MSDPFSTSMDGSESVREEARLLEEVLEVLRKDGRAGAIPDYDRELMQMRDLLATERLEDDQAMWLEQMDRVAAVASVRAQRTVTVPDLANPYFAHMRLHFDDGKERDFLLGRCSFMRGGVRIVDWRHAPISRIFYRYQEGEFFVEEIAKREVEGQVTLRRVVTVVDGRLVRVADARGAFLRESTGWRDVSDRSSSLAGGSGQAARPDTAPLLLGVDGGSGHREDKRLPAIAALLDEEQYALMGREGQHLLVVSGGAGSGKTTVALHRLAYLNHQNPQRYRANRMMVLVFGRALARYIGQVLPALGVKGVEVGTLNAWAQSTRQRHFPRLTTNLSEFTPTSVLRFKTHRIMLPMLAEATQAEPEADPVRLFDELFSDLNWMRQGVARHAPDAFSELELVEVHRWCADQHFRRADTERDEDYPACYDEEDGMILLRLYQLLKGRLRYSYRRGLSYDHLVIDEVQDFSPLEIRVLLECVRDESMTLAGDPAQRITDNDFEDWPQVLSAIGCAQAEVADLKVSYRSTRPITELARAVLGPLAPEEPSVAPREGAPVELLRFGSIGAGMTFVADALVELMQREPLASVAVLCPTPEDADEAFDALRRAETTWLSRVADQDFSFGPGVEVTDVAQTKGLEFDYVVLLGVDAKRYPKTSTARHLLHVGLTRAIHQAWLITWQRSSALLPDKLKARLSG